LCCASCLSLRFPTLFSGKYPLINDDLVNSHHLLLCCLDMLHSAAYTKRNDLLNPDSPIRVGEEEEEEGLEGVGISVLGQLCEKFNGEFSDPVANGHGFISG